MIDMSLNFFCSFRVLVVTLCLTHQAYVLLIYSLHLDLVKLFVRVFGLDCFLNVLSDFFYTETPFFG